MPLTSFTVKDYKSIRNVSIHPARIMALIGPNNSGKSNLVDALSFLSDAYSQSVRYALDKRGGFDNVVHRPSKKKLRTIEFSVKCEWDKSVLFDRFGMRSFLSGPMFSTKEGGVNHLTLEHDFTIEEVSAQSPRLSASPISDRGYLASRFSIARERIVIHAERNGENHEVISLVRSRSRLSLHLPIDEEFRSIIGFFYDQSLVAFIKEQLRQSMKLDPESLLLDKLNTYFPSMYFLVRELTLLKLYQLNPNECRQPSPASSSRDLGSQGTNLPSVIYNLKLDSPSTLDEVSHHMKAFFPRLTRIDVRPTNARLWEVVFVESPSATWSASEVSDGTIRALALFTVILDPVDRVVMIEEPENALHPWVIRDFLNTCEEQTEFGKQIFLTSHSPALIDILAPKDIMIAWKSNTGTQISRLSDLEPNLEGSISRGEVGLFEFIDSGYLAENTPGVK